jgi:hypothetical protein
MLLCERALIYLGLDGDVGRLLALFTPRPLPAVVDD